MSKDKYSKKFQYKVLNRCNIDNIYDCVRDKKWVKVKKMKMVGTVLMLEMIMLKMYCVKEAMLWNFEKASKMKEVVIMQEIT